MPNTMVTSTSTLAPTMQSFYDKNLLENAKTQFVFNNFAQKRPMPKNRGKKIIFRKWELFPADPAAQKLTEGVTPAAQSLSMTEIEATVDQYGAYVEASDLLTLTAYDDVIGDSTELLGEQLGNVSDMITRDTISTSTNVQFANGKAAVNNIAAADVLTVDEIRKAVRTLKKNKARKYTRSGGKPHYICICDPSATYDLQSDPLWQDVSKYSNAEAIYEGELGRLFGVVFVETTNEKVVNNGTVDVHDTWLFGKDSYGTVDIDGSGAIKAIIKPHGSAGTADPLDQRATIGAKITAFTAKVLCDEWLIVIRHAVTA